MEVRRVTVAEFHAELKAQGVPSREHCAVKCFMCDTVQSIQSFIAIGVARDTAEKMIAFSCIGRVRGSLRPSQAKGKGVGCNWTLGGLFGLCPYVVIDDDGREKPTFPPATAEEAQALHRQLTAAEVA